jgi:hypothetical protein
MIDSPLRAESPAGRHHKCDGAKLTVQGFTLRRGGTTGTAPVNFNVPVTLSQGDQLLARIDSDTRINLSGIRFPATLTYNTEIEGLPAPALPDGTAALKLELPVTAQVYSTAFTGPVNPVAPPHHNPPTPWIAPGGPVQVTQEVSGPAGLSGRIALAAKSGGVLLSKHIVNLVGGSDSFSVTYNLPAGTPVFFTAEVTNRTTFAAVGINPPTTADGASLPFDIRVDYSGIDPFGGGYRDWWFGDYTPTDPAAPIDQTLLRLPVDNTDPVFRQFIGMLPFQAEDRWQARGGANGANNSGAGGANPRTPSTSAFISGALMSSTRLGAPVIDLPDGTTFGGPQAVTKTGSSTNTAEQISLLFFGAGRSNGTTQADIDFLDFNGDGYPDVVGGGSLRATLPNGALDGRRIPLGVSEIRQSTVVSENVNLGATTSALRDTADLFGLNIASEQAPYNIGLGVGSTASTGSTTAVWDLIDINGDGLPDLVGPLGTNGLQIRLNLGYRFGALESWVAPFAETMRLERTAAAGFEGSAGFTTPAYSFGGGTSSTKNQAGTERDLIDVNGDGLPDLVYKAVNSDITSGGTTIQVRLNTGAGFLPAQTWNGAQPLPIQSRSGVHRLVGAHFSAKVGTAAVGLGMLDPFEPQ